MNVMKTNARAFDRFLFKSVNLELSRASVNEHLNRSTKCKSSETKDKLILFSMSIQHA